MSIRSILAVLVLGSAIAACSSSGTVTSDSSTSTSTSIYPSWYNSSGFAVDSTSFYAYGSAIAGDSLQAIEKATASAKLNLEKDIANRLESIRFALAEAGNSDVTNTDYFIILREAHQNIEKASAVENVTTSKSGNGYRSFVQANLSKEVALSHLEKGFNGHPRYWGALSGADAFKSLMSSN